jgi:hypothetical protein
MVLLRAWCHPSDDFGRKMADAIDAKLIRVGSDRVFWTVPKKLRFVRPDGKGVIVASFEGNKLPSVVAVVGNCAGVDTLEVATDFGEVDADGRGFQVVALTADGVKEAIKGGKPRVLITTDEAVKVFHATRRDFYKALKNKQLVSHRPAKAGKTVQHSFSFDDVATLFPKRMKPLP